MSSHVVHNPELHRFEIHVGGSLAVAEYEEQGNEMVFTHTFVPPELRGRGLAAELVEAGLAFAKEQGRKVVPACSYVAAYLKRRGQDT